jgi:hypothetical protein
MRQSIGVNDDYDPSQRSGRTAVLLGAGASRDAGLPLTESLAQRLVESFDDELEASDQYEKREQGPVVRALHIVYGAMVAHATEQGASPLSAVNVERLVSAVRLLRDRRTHEAAPFVDSWRGSVEEVDDHPLPLNDRALSKHVGFKRDLSFEISGLANDIATIAKAVTSPGDGAVFRRLEDQLLRRICLLLSTPGDVQYLFPLVELAQRQKGGLDITTLNYDRTVEIAAAMKSVPIDTGMGRWSPGQPLVFTPTNGQINLIKPHGSVDWVRVSGTAERPLKGQPLVRHAYRIDFQQSSVVSRWVRESPLIVIGDREKLETDGPTLPLMRAFEESLHRAQNLVVVGYSFGDEHVNTVIRNWLIADDARTITVLDPNWRGGRFAIGHEAELSMADTIRYLAGVPLTVTSGRVMIVKKGTKDGLAEALSANPLGLIPEPLSITEHPGECHSLEITNNGYLLEYLKVSAWSASRGYNQARLQLHLELGGAGQDSVEVKALAHGASFRVYLDPIHNGEKVGQVHLRGQSWAHYINDQRVLHSDE